MKVPLVHRAANTSDFDTTGRMTQYRVGTCCGLTLSTPRVVTTSPEPVTCKRCRLSQKVWDER